MTIVEMLGQSGVLTLLGMGIVFSFLIILVVVIEWTGRMINAKGLDTDTAVPSAQTGISAKMSETGNGAEITAAITAAISEYRKSH